MVSVGMSALEWRGGLAGYVLLANGLGYATYRIGLRRRIEAAVPMPRHRIALLGLMGGAAGALFAALRARHLVRRPPLKRVMMVILMLQIGWLLGTATPWSTRIDQEVARLGTITVAELGQIAHDLTHANTAPTQVGIRDADPNQSGPQSFWHFGKGAMSGITFVPAS